ncbi:MAG: sulfatase-like hydrolase/transferase [bacterium]|nr:sulfatase-like hydrolase/transferase [bacterium]
MAGLGSLALARTGWAAPDRERPNILFLFADDQTYEAVHALGCREIHTPNLDRLVKKGVTFTHAHNMGAWHGAVCMASRTMLNTGRFLWRAKDGEKRLGQDVDQGRFWSQGLGEAGYRTYFSGKWHVKADPAKVFDVARNVRPGMPNQTPQGYNRPVEGKEDVWRPWDTQYEGFWKGGKHWSEVLGDDGVEFLEQTAAEDDPFFMYLAFNAPHDPRQSPKRFVDQYPLKKISVPENYLPEYPYKDAMGCSKGLRDEKLAPFPRTEYAVKVHRQEYYAIITHMDEQIGRVLDALERTGQADNTYIFFTADHGLACGHHGLLGKQSMFDHSMRAPLIVNGPGLPKRKRISTPVYLQDIMPTTFELAGAPTPEHVEFRSLLPLITKERDEQYEAIYGAYMDRQRMVMDDRMKLIWYPKIDRVLLFDLKKDPQEMRDLSENPKHAEELVALKAKLKALQEEMGDPLKDLVPGGGVPKAG